MVRVLSHSRSRAHQRKRADHCRLRSSCRRPSCLRRRPHPHPLTGQRAATSHVRPLGCLRWSRPHRAQGSSCGCSARRSSDPSSGIASARCSIRCRAVPVRLGVAAACASQRLKRIRAFASRIRPALVCRSRSHGGLPMLDREQLHLNLGVGPCQPDRARCPGPEHQCRRCWHRQAGSNPFRDLGSILSPLPRRLHPRHRVLLLLLHALEWAQESRSLWVCLFLSACLCGAFLGWRLATFLAR